MHRRGTEAEERHGAEEGQRQCREGAGAAERQEQEEQGQRRGRERSWTEGKEKTGAKKAQKKVRDCGKGRDTGKVQKGVGKAHRKERNRNSRGTDTGYGQRRYRGRGGTE